MKEHFRFRKKNEEETCESRTFANGKGTKSGKAVVGEEERGEELRCVSCMHQLPAEVVIRRGCRRANKKEHLLTMFL